MTKMHILEQACQVDNLYDFLSLAFPPDWSGITARIIETGAEFAPQPCAWAPRWSLIPKTIRKGPDDLTTAVKSVIFRVHDCIHQLWGLPHPGNFTTDDLYYYKRSQMCGEVAVLTLTEFVYCDYLRRQYPELAHLITKRNAIPMLDGPLAGKSVEQIAMRMDDLMHKMSKPRWVREHPASTAFVADYVPMLERDRQQIDHNWALMREANWKPDGAPKARFGPNMDGLELTIWMIHDFQHQMATSSDIDWALAAFNRERRSKLILPSGWVS